MCEGVERVSLKSEPGISGMSAVIAFSSHYTASMAKKVVVEGRWDCKHTHGVYNWIAVHTVLCLSKYIYFYFQAFKKQYSLGVSINWLPSEKSCPNQLLLPKDVFPKSSLWLPLQTPSLSNSPGFCRAVGGPTAPQQPYICPTTSSLVSATSPMMLLNNMCQRAGFGKPHYEISCCHAGRDGYLHFSYEVFILGINRSFDGVVMILPGASATSTMQEARGAVAQQVLCRLFQNQFSQWANHHRSATFATMFNAPFDFLALLNIFL